MSVEWRPPTLAQNPSPQQRFTSPFHTLNRCFSWLQKNYCSTFFFFFFYLFHHLTRKHSFLWISWTPAQHQVQIEKIPLANFNIGRTTVLPTQPLFQARSSDLSPWAHKAGFHFHPQASLMKNSFSPDPQPRGSDTSVCVNLGIFREESQRDSLLLLTFKCTTVPAQSCSFPHTVVYVWLTLSFGKYPTESHPP